MCSTSAKMLSVTFSFSLADTRRLRKVGEGDARKGRGQAGAPVDDVLLVFAVLLHLFVRGAARRARSNEVLLVADEHDRDTRALIIGQLLLNVASPVVHYIEAASLIHIVPVTRW